jgi:hypothetical protein
MGNPGSPQVGLGSGLIYRPDGRIGLVPTFLEFYLVYLTLRFNLNPISTSKTTNYLKVGGQGCQIRYNNTILERIKFN